MSFVPNKFACAMLTIVVVNFICLHSASAQARDEMALGNAAYAKGDYAQARRHFEHVTMTRPNWLAYYHLANCDVKLHDINRAEQEYKVCMKMTSDPKVLKTCSVAIQNIAVHRQKGSLAQASSGVPIERPANAEAIAAGNDINAKKALLKILQAEQARNELTLKLVVQADDEFKKRRAAAIARREQILDEGQKQAEAARAKGRAEVKDNSTYLCRNTHTGELSINIPTVIEKDIEAKWEAEAQRLIKESEIRARGVHVPDYDNTAHHFVNGLQDKSKGGTKMSHIGTNLYVRSYTHTPKSTVAKTETANPVAAKPEVQKQIAGTSAVSTPAK